jgi:HEAT repeat protein
MPPARPFWAVLLTLALASPSWAQAQPMQPKYPSEVGGKTESQWRDLLTHPDPSIREEAIRAIILFGPMTGDSLKALLSRLVDCDASPRTAAVIVLGFCELHKDDHHLVVEALAKRLDYSDDINKREPQGVTRLHAALSLGRFGDEAKAAIPALALSTRDPSSFEIRRAAVRSLAGASYVKGGPPDVRGFHAIAGVISFSDKNLETSAAVKLEAIIALGSLGKCNNQDIQRETERSLLLIARGSDPVLKIWATVSLMMMVDRPDEKLIADIGTMTKANQKELRVRLNAIRAIGVMGSAAKNLMPELMDALNDPEQAVIIQACQSVGAMGKDGKKAVPKLITLLKHEEPLIVYQACAALAGLGKEASEALPALKELSEREGVFKPIKEAAKMTIEQINKPAKP